MAAVSPEPDDTAKRRTISKCMKARRASSSPLYGLRAYAQTDPVVAYKKEGYEMFEQMIAAIQEETLRRLFLVRIQRKAPDAPAPEIKR